VELTDGIGTSFLWSLVSEADTFKASIYKGLTCFR